MSGIDIAPQSHGQDIDLATTFQLISTIFSKVSNPAFRRKERDFTRHGPLDPELLTTLLLYMVADGNRRGYQGLLTGFWDEARSYGLALPTEDAVSGASFCTARRKVTSDLLRRLIHEASDTFDESFGGPLRWYGRRIFAVDGTKVNLQRSQDLDKAYGTPHGAHCPQVLLSVLLDLCGKVPVDLQISPFASSERDHLFAMLPRLKAGDVLVLDRGYPSHEVLQALVKAKIDFLIRVPSSSTFSAIDLIQHCQGNDYRVLIDPPDSSPEDWQDLELRALRLKNRAGEESYFLTTLRRVDFSGAQIGDLYHLRWEAEEFFKLLKGPYIGQGQFRSKSPEGVRQEMHALVLFLAISRFLMATAARVNDADFNSLSQKAAVLAIADYITRLFLYNDPSIAACHLRALLQRIANARYRKRAGRSFLRVSFKPSKRWGPKGRRGA